MSSPNTSRLAAIFGALAVHYSDPSDGSSAQGVCTNDRCEAKNVQAPLTLGNCPECNQPLTPLPTDEPTTTPEPATAPSYDRPEAAATVQAAATQALQERFGFDLTDKPRVEIDPELLQPEQDEEE